MKLNKRQLQFLQEYMSNGRNATLAYSKVYNNDNFDSCRASACKLLAHPNVKEELNRIEEELKEQSKVNQEELIRDLLNIKNSNITDFVNIKKNKYIETKIDFETGEPYDEEVWRTELEYKETENLPDYLQKQIKSIEMTKYGPKIVLYEKDKAIDTLNKMLGFYNENVNLNTTIDTSSLNGFTDEQLINLVEEDK